VVLGASDAGAPRTVVGRLRRAAGEMGPGEGVFTMEELVHSNEVRPAVRLRGRGRVAPGTWADIVV